MERYTGRYGGGAQTDLYINRISATLVPFTKVLEGAWAGFLLFQIVRAIVVAISELSKGAKGISQLLEQLFSRFGLPAPGIGEYTGTLVEGLAVPFFIWVLLLTLVVTGLVLTIVETITLFSLRFGRRGASLVKGIHIVYMIMAILELVFFIFTIVSYVIHYGEIAAMVRDDDAMLGLNVVMIALAVILLIVMLLVICYHKDIAMAMTTVSYETETGRRGDLRRTHLSGISFIFGVIYLLSTLSVVFTILGAQSEGVRGVWNAQSIFTIVVMAIMTIKQFAVCFCNRNLKKAR